jgi:tRNA nucleotidyltransferase/poly(A) polymerase
LLGKDPHDIDIAMTMGGVAFAHLINDYLTERGEEPKHVGIIKPNPKAGKHLEVATVKLFGTLNAFRFFSQKSGQDLLRLPASSILPVLIRI